VTRTIKVWHWLCQCAMLRRGAGCPTCQNHRAACIALLFGMVATLLLLAAGCQPQGQATSRERSSSLESSEHWREELLTYAENNLGRLDQFDADDTAMEIVTRIGRPNPLAEGETDHVLATWPQSEMQRQVISRLNQWSETQTPPPWKLDPLVATWPERVFALPVMSGLDKIQFTAYDGFGLQEAVWLHDLAASAGGDTLDDLARATRLFDWLVRNIQIEVDSATRVPQVPWEVLQRGRATAGERAWVFMLLLRQLGIDSGVLAFTDPANPGATFHWCVAVLAAKNGADETKPGGKRSGENLYLFDTGLGMPIPAPGDIKLAGKNGSLAIRPATLDEVVAKPELLKRLDIGPGRPYWVSKIDRAHLEVLVDGSPLYLSRRMALLESHLSGKHKLVLTASPAEQAKRLQTAAHAAGSGVWPVPYLTYARRGQLSTYDIRDRLREMLPFYVLRDAPLLRGRVLQLKGQFVGESGATQYFQTAWKSNREIDDFEREEKAEFLKPRLPALDSLPASERESRTQQLNLEALAFAHFLTMACRDGKQCAGYWLGHLAYEQGNYDSAVDYFLHRTLDAFPGGPWTNGARYNLGRCYEAQGKLREAIEEYKSHPEAAGGHGCVLRAKWLEKLVAGEKSNTKK
jgi:hypothetical protein